MQLAHKREVLYFSKYILQKNVNKILMRIKLNLGFQRFFSKSDASEILKFIETFKGITFDFQQKN